MSFKLYKAINHQIDFVIRRLEIYDGALERQGKTGISIYDIFQAEKIKNEKKQYYCKLIINELKKTVPDIVDINFYEDLENNNGIYIIFELKKGNKNVPIILGYSSDDKFYFPFDDITRFDTNKTILLDKNKNLCKEIAEYGINNNFNKMLRINTISNRFQLQTTKNSLSIVMSNDLIQWMGKYVYLNYYFNQDNLKNKIQTSEGMFNVNTNVPGVKRLLSSSMNPKYFRGEELNSTLRFLQNLRVYESDVPEYLREEIQKVKVLKNK